MLIIDEGAADRPDLQGAYFETSLELLRELAVTNDVNAALPRLSAIVGKMLPHDALRMACFDQRGRPVVKASTADVPDMSTRASEGATCRLPLISTISANRDRSTHHRTPRKQW